MSGIKPRARKEDIVVQEYGKEILIYDLKANKAYNLNETSMLIWQLSNGDKTLSEIADDLSTKLGSSINEEFVWLALEQLRKENLVENKTEIETLYQGVSRREIIKRVGLASLVALPIVSGLVAPAAINAQSVICSTAAPGGVQCRCDCASVMLGETCDGGLTVDPCNPGCICTRTATGCYGGTNPTLIGTAQGTCS